MVAHTVRVLIFVLFPLLVWGQSLNLSVSPPTNNNNPSTFLLTGGEVELSSNAIRFLDTGTTFSNYDAIGISRDYSVVSILERTGERGKVTVLNSRGMKLNSFSTVVLSNDDPSLNLYPTNNGNILLRDNISNFTFYSSGKIATSMSSSSQSKDGEKISQVAMSDDQKTVIIYSPKIKRDSNFGSKAQLKMSDGSFKDIFFSSDRYMKTMNVSDDGNMVVAITAKSGTDDQAVILDKYGNKLTTISADENLRNAVFSAENEYVTVYSTGRVMVYSVPDGNSLGATSFSSSVFLAEYFPEDNLILALTGNYAERARVLNNVEFRAVNLKQRSITSKEFSGSLGFIDNINASFDRSGPNEYQLMGSSKRIQIKTNF